MSVQNLTYGSSLTVGAPSLLPGDNTARSCSSPGANAPGNANYAIIAGAGTSVPAALQATTLFAVNYWFKPSIPVATNPNILNIGGNFSTASVSIIVNSNTSPNYFQSAYQYPATGGSFKYAGTTNTYTINGSNVYMVTQVWNGANVLTYVNGVLDSNQPAFATASLATNNYASTGFALMGTASGANVQMTGNLSDVAVWINVTAPNQSQITNLYTLGTTVAAGVNSPASAKLIRLLP
jgi:hypothetical protein